MEEVRSGRGGGSEEWVRDGGSEEWVRDGGSEEG